ncbi:MAG: zf-HC2 domain-containing protein [Gemmatimonadetes bacterium]|nr:zf-HC2 domain-containing protein [Gemmatimonadota bacterium]
MTHPNLSCEAFEAQLPTWLEGELDVSATADAELHLAACAACRAVVAELERLADAAAALPVLSPSRDLWAGIEARIAAPVVALPVRPARPRWQLGAVAAGLVAVTALSTWQVARRTAPVETRVVAASAAPLDTATPAAALTTPAPTPVITPVAANPQATRPSARVTYADEITRLQALVAARANDLDPATVAIIQSSIATIDQAIVEAKAALENDPASRFLESQLNKSLERKLGLLRKAALLASST